MHFVFASFCKHFDIPSLHEKYHDYLMVENFDFVINLMLMLNMVMWKHNVFI